MPEVTTPRSQLFEGDCLDVMAALSEASVDLVLADLPYGTTQCRWDTPIPLDLLWAELKRVLKPCGAAVMTASQPFTSLLVTSNLAWFKYCWVWEKSRPGDIFNAKNKPLKAHEDVCVFSGGTTANGSPSRMPYFPQGVGAGGVRTNNPDEAERAFKGKRPSHLPQHVTSGSNYPRSVIRIPNPNRGSFHPTQKPVALGEYLIRTYTNPGDVVLDPTMGSGSFGVAALNANRQFIGIERDSAYFATAKARITAEAGLFEIAAE